MSVSYRAQTARVTGARHVRAGEMCQDAALCGVRGELAFYGLADGQSGARFGLEGAQAALTVIRDTAFYQRSNRRFNHTCTCPRV